MKLTVDIHSHGRQERPYGPSVAEATISIELERGIPRENQFRNYFCRTVCNVPDNPGPDDWFVYSWDKVEQIDEATWKLRATRPYDD